MPNERKATNDLRNRLQQYSLRIMKLYARLAKTTVAQVIGKQVLRSGTSVGAHYAEAFRAKSKPDFINKIEGATQELEETMYWLDLLIAAEIISEEKLAPLKSESEELMAIFVSMITRTKRGMS